MIHSRLIRGVEPDQCGGDHLVDPGQRTDDVAPPKRPASISEIERFGRTPRPASGRERWRHHRHEPRECAAAFASWAGFDSPLRHERAPSSCLTGDHSLWWRVTAASRREALALLPSFVATRAAVTEVREVEIP